MAAVIERVDRLEEALARLTFNVDQSLQRLAEAQLRTEQGMRELQEGERQLQEGQRQVQAGLVALQDEVRRNVEEGRRQRADDLRQRELQRTADARRQADAMQALEAARQEREEALRRQREEDFRRQEATMQALEAARREREEVRRRDRQEFRESMREMNRQWGTMANKLGTIVEDLVYPSLPRLVQETLDEDIIDLTVRHKRRDASGRQQEFDAIAVTPTHVLLNSTKSTLQSADVDAFIDEIAVFRQMFPEHAALSLVGLLASLSVDQSVLNYAEKKGFLVAAIGDQLMDLQNHPGFVPVRW